MEKLKLFLRYMHTTLTEKLWYQINLFNGASNGAIVLSTERAPIMAGGLETESLFRLPDRMIRRRNPDGYEPLDIINLSNKTKNNIRIAWSTEQLNMSRNVWDWIGRDYRIAGLKFGEAMAMQMIQEYILRAFSILKATIGANDTTVIDVTKEAGAESGITYNLLNYAADIFGDAAGNIRAWIMSTVLKTDLLQDNLKNQSRLFKVENVTIATDIEGRTIITSDDPNLRDVSADGKTADYWAFGLVQSAIVITDLDDWDELGLEQGGAENIKRGYQANWSSKISVLGYKYDESQLNDSDDDRGKFATASDAALGAPENWAMWETSHKFSAGVAVKCRTNRPSYAQPKMYNHN